MSSTTMPVGELSEAIAGRLARLRSDLEADALLVADPIDIRYLSGFVGDDSLLLVARETAWIISDTRYEEYLEPWRDARGFAVLMGTRHRLEAAVRGLAGEHGLRRIAIQAERLTVAARDALGTALAGTAELVDTRGVVAALRRRKDEVEVAAIERAVAIQQAALTAALRELRVGMTELEFAARLEFEMKSRGASAASFGTIVASGANSSIIHHLPSAASIEPGVLLVDWGAVESFYCSDMTRTFGLGGMPPEIAGIYPIVLEAQLAAIEAAAPGRSCAEIDAVARDLITRAGYGPQFGHGLGHGLGLEIHEAPYFNALESDTLLEPGMVMTVEPGIYLPGVGGVRIEDDVLITEDGCRVLNSLPKDLDAMVVTP